MKGKKKKKDENRNEGRVNRKGMEKRKNGET